MVHEIKGCLAGLMQEYCNYVYSRISLLRKELSWPLLDMAGQVDVVSGVVYCQLRGDLMITVTNAEFLPSTRSRVI